MIHMVRLFGFLHINPKYIGKSHPLAEEGYSVTKATSDKTLFSTGNRSAFVTFLAMPN